MMQASRTTTLLAMAICILLLAVAAPISQAADSSRPNIVFLLIDDMGWPDVACYGHPFHETPRIDQLCDESVKFTDFYAATPVCSSTRCTIQSGQYSARVGITDFLPGHWRPFEKLIVPPMPSALPPELKTPGDALKAAGYVTGYFGKWHLGNNPAEAPDKRGYDVTERTISPEFKKARGAKSAGPKRIDLLTDQTIWFLEQNKDRPFFITLSHHAVHIPVEGTSKSIDKYREKPKPADGVNHPVYAAMVEDLDRSIGRILDTLDELELSDNTMVVFTSDNGGLRKIYTGVGEIVSTNAPLRDEKGSLYEGGIRVPMIVRWPGVIPAGSICDEPATTADLLPTFCQVVGADLPDQPIDGASLLPLLKEPTAELARDAIYFHYPHYHHSRPGGAIRVGDLKLIEFFDGSPLELYNLADDLGEADDLADRMPNEVKRMQAHLADWRKAVGARMPTPNPNHDAARAPEWWSRRTNQPLDLEAMERHYRTKQTKK